MGKVALTLGFAVVADDAVVRAQVGGLTAAVGDVEADVDQIAAFGESINFVDFQTACFRCAQADFNFVAFQAVLFFGALKPMPFRMLLPCASKSSDWAT